MKSIRNILISQPYGLGDALFITPVLRALKTIPSVETVDLLLGSRTEPVFRNNPHVDRIFSIDKGKWHRSKMEMWKDIACFSKEMRNQYDLLIDFSLQREYGFYGQFFFGIPTRIGFNYNGRGTFLTHSIPLPLGYEGKHVVDFYSELVGLIDLEVEDRFLEFFVSEEEQQEADRILKQRAFLPTKHFVVVAPGGGESWGQDAVFKRWPVTYFIESLKLLKQRIDFEGILIVGSPGERELGEAILQGSGYPVVNLCGELSLGASAAVLEKALLFFGNDGGLVHLARALDTPLMALYGPVNPRVYGPYPTSLRAVSIVKKNLPCRPCYNRFHYNAACPDQECLRSLFPAEVFSFLDKKNFWNFTDTRIRFTPSVKTAP